VNSSYDLKQKQKPYYFEFLKITKPSHFSLKKRKRKEKNDQFEVKPGLGPCSRLVNHQAGPLE